MAAYIRVKENPNGPTDLYGIDQFTYWLVARLVSSGQVHALEICGVGLQLRNRSSRFRFCTFVFWGSAFAEVYQVVQFLCLPVCVRL